MSMSHTTHSDADPFTQLGVALGFVLPPLLVGNHADLDMVGSDLQLMFYLIAGFTTILVLLVLFRKYIIGLNPWRCRWRQ